MAAVAGASIPCHSGWVGGKTARPCSGLPHTGAPSASATATSASMRAGLRHLVPGDDGELPGRGSDDHGRQPVEVGGDRPVVDGGARRHRRLDLAVEVVHADGDEHRPARRGGGVPEGAAQDGAELVGRPHLVGPLADRAGEADQVAREQRVVDQVPLVLLPGGHHERGAVGPGVGEAADRVAEAGGGVQVHEGRTPSGLRVAVGHADRSRLLERQHVVEVVRRRERVDQRELGAPRVAEDVGDALACAGSRAGRHGRARRRTYIWRKWLAETGGYFLRKGVWHGGRTGAGYARTDLAMKRRHP